MGADLLFCGGPSSCSGLFPLGLLQLESDLPAFERWLTTATGSCLLPPTTALVTGVLMETGFAQCFGHCPAAMSWLGRTPPLLPRTQIQSTLIESAYEPFTQTTTAVWQTLGVGLAHFS